MVKLLRAIAMPAFANIGNLPALPPRTYAASFIAITVQLTYAAAFIPVLSSLSAMQPLFLFFYKWLSIARNQRQRPSGFTLLELLISLAISFVVMGGLIFMVMELTTMDRRENNLDQVQRDMNRAMAFIVDDLQEAVYVYTNPQQMATQLGADPKFPDGTGEVPILAFWRIDPIESGFPTCNSTTMTTAVFQNCNLLRIRQAAYTLVVYVQKKNDGNGNWPGQSRIIRYELPKYASTIPTNLAERGGYRDPTDPIDPLAAFETWESDGTPEGIANVLVDYVQAPTFTPAVALNRAPLNHTGGPCQGYGDYSVVPSTATTSVNNTFFACVRNPSLGGVGTRGSQDVFVFLRGNVQSINGGVRGYSNRTSLPILETQVLVKGVVNKGFSE
jgi:prepilin-type N-terminal cleavage/methylation domain-containing protein